VNWRVLIAGVTPPPETVKFAITMTIAASARDSALVVAGAILHRKVGKFGVAGVEIERIDDQAGTEQAAGPVDG